MRRPRHAEAGMSLLEVVVAVVGIVVLGAVILSVWVAAARPREHSVSYSCKSNLRQIAKACVEYSEPYGDFWPAASALDGSIHPDPSRSLILLYPRYVDSLRAFGCPSTKDKPDAYAVSRNGRSWLEFGAHEKGERIPLTIANADKKKGGTLRAQLSGALFGGKG